MRNAHNTSRGVCSENKWTRRPLQCFQPHQHAFVCHNSVAMTTNPWRDVVVAVHVVHLFFRELSTGRGRSGFDEAPSYFQMLSTRGDIRSYNSFGVPKRCACICPSVWPCLILLILIAFLYECESWTLILREEHRLRIIIMVFLNGKPCRLVDICISTKLHRITSQNTVKLQALSA
jgi:hypothetical protein